MKEGNDLLATVKKNVKRKKKAKGTKYTNDYILGYLDAVAAIQDSTNVTLSAFTIASFQDRCREWAGKPPITPNTSKGTER